MLQDPTTKLAHSPLGASGAERWLACPGSVSLLKELELPESDDPTFRLEGQAMHHFGETCLKDGTDAWEVTGQEHEGIVLDAPMALHVQSYLDYVRPIAAAANKSFVEYAISAPSIHPLFYGRCDFGAILPDRLVVVDLKGGKGIVVEPDDNAQCKYYAFGLIYGLEDAQSHAFPGDMPVDLTIVQPRAWHSDGPIRTWTTTVGEIKEWVHDTLVPAMANVEIDDSLDAGPWCRFCPAKLVCPLMTSLFGAAAKANPKHVVNLNDQSLGRSYQGVQAVKFYLKALEEETLRRLLSAHEVPGTKLVNKKANRVWSPGAADLAKEKFGDDAFVPAALKGPAAIDALGPEGSLFTRGHAFTPNTGLTVALEADKRPAVPVAKAQEAFGDLAKAYSQSSEA